MRAPGRFPAGRVLDVSGGHNHLKGGGIQPPGSDLIPADDGPPGYEPT